jgi:pimeloyl-ACP methyl ester carboxylesterase
MESQEQGVRMGSVAIGDARRPASGETVVLVHGLGGSGMLMWPLARRLGQAGYSTQNWAYRSYSQTIQRHADQFRQRLGELDADPQVSRLHLVTHSMGTIVARCALAEGQPTKLGRWVMLAPPNHGSPVATFWGPKLRWCVPVIDQLAKRSDSFVNLLPQPDRIEFGVIAASMDWMVGSGNSCLPCQRDYIVLPATHTSLLFRRRSADETIEFLSTGRFSTAACRE